jgi:hypothetical protein
MLACAAAVHSCGHDITDADRLDRDNADVVSITLTLAPGTAVGSPAAPLPFQDGAGVPFTAHIAVLGDDGNPLANFNSFVAVSTDSGEIVSIAGANGTTVDGRNVQVTAGVADVTITLTRALGETRIWAEDEGYVPAPAMSATLPQCANSMDDDGDGLVDFPGDFGCAAPNDNTETGGSYVLGASGPIVFDTPTISQVQGHSTSSPLTNVRVLVNHGNLIITAVNVSGMYVTDTADPGCPGMGNCYNSIFLFNFSLPPFVQPCDRLSQLEGTVTEFVSTTQMGNPSWIADPDGEWINPTLSGACPIPPAVPVDATALANANAMEALESSVVVAQGVTFSSNIGPMLVAQPAMGGAWQFARGQSNCDFTNDGQIDFHHPQEGPCANACQTTPNCSEWTDWVRFGQLAVDFVPATAGAVRLIVEPKSVLPNFNPQAPPVPAGTAVAVTGTLSEVGPNWIISPRCADDVALNNMPRAANLTCISPRTEEQENP